MALFARKPPRRPAVPPGERVYAIGDVHGRLDLFDDLLARIAADAHARGRAATTVVLLGDLVDRGPDSAGVVRRAMTPLAFARTVHLRGNHEAALLDALDGDAAMLALWLRIGGIEAARSWGVDETALREAGSADLVVALRRAIGAEACAWLAAGQPFFRAGDYFLVHAGVKPGVALDRQREADMLWIRDRFLDSDRAHGAMIVHGHSIAAEVDERVNRIGIDTGAYASGRLTALGLEGEERWTLATDGPPGPPWRPPA